MHPDEDLKKRVGRKLTKKRKVQRAPTVEIPERFKDGDDAQEDAAACRGQQAQYMNQSVFSMIAAAGSRADFHSRFDDESSGSDEDSRQQPPTVARVSPQTLENPSEELLDEPQQEVLAKARSEKHRRKLSEYRLLRSLPKLNPRTFKEKNYMSESGVLPSKDLSAYHGSSQSVTPRDAPVMSRMLEAEAEAQLHLSTTNFDRKKEMAAITEDTEVDHNSTTLALRLMEIFSYEKPEEVISGRVLSICSSLCTNTIQSIHAGCFRVCSCKDICTSLNITYASTLTYQGNL